MTAVAELPDGFVPTGFSLAGAIPVSAFGDDVRWPAGVPGQTHSTLADPWREQEEIDQPGLRLTADDTSPTGSRTMGLAAGGRCVGRDAKAASSLQVDSDSL